jgi:protein gp37
VYVDDPDDWDLPDKTFELTMTSSLFNVDVNTGFIRMQSEAGEGTYNLTFKVISKLFGSVFAKIL